MKFKERSRVRSVKAEGEAAGADGEAAGSPPEHPAQITDEGGYAKQQILVQTKQPSRKKMPSRTFIAREEKSVPGFGVQTDALFRGWRSW